MNFTFQQLNYACQIKLALLSLLIMQTSCTHQPYQAKPLNPAAVNAKLANKDATSADFKSYLSRLGYAQADDKNKLPFAEWGIDELTLCALYFNPTLDVAKAQLVLAGINVSTADQRQSPTISGRTARSNQANGDKSPWAFGLEVEIPIETTNKRQIKVEEAQYLKEVARLDVADVAWQLRSKIAKDLLDFHENIAQQQQLNSELIIQNSLVQMLQKRAQLGATSNTELNAAKLLQQKSQFLLNSEQSKSVQMRVALAADVGLSDEKFALLQLKPLDIEAALLTAPSPPQLQQKALLNRLDIRRGLAKYGAAESKIKLEIAKQTPDISLSPGFAFEFGDSIWSLGFATLLNLLNKNATLIAQATQLREIEGAQFEALQAGVIADANLANAAFVASQQHVTQLRQQLAAQQQVTQKLQRQLEAGQLDRYELSQNKLITSLLQQQLLIAKFKQLNALVALENSVQMPLNTNNILGNKTIQLQRVIE